MIEDQEGIEDQIILGVTLVQENLAQGQEKCIKLLVLTAGMNVKFLLSQEKISQYIANPATLNTSPKDFNF